MCNDDFPIVFTAVLSADQVEALETELATLEYADAVWTQKDLDRQAEIYRLLDLPREG